MNLPAARAADARTRPEKGIPFPEKAETAGKVPARLSEDTLLTAQGKSAFAAAFCRSAAALPRSAAISGFPTFSLSRPLAPPYRPGLPHPPFFSRPCPQRQNGLRHGTVFPPPCPRPRRSRRPPQRPDTEKRWQSSGVGITTEKKRPLRRAGLRMLSRVCDILGIFFFFSCACHAGCRKKNIRFIMSGQIKTTVCSLTG